jgi:hypothetical protein
MTKVAMCTVCKNEPLVCTFVFKKKEFICLGCGRTFEFFGPASADETPELLEKMHSREKAWKELSNGYMPVGMVRVDDCEECKQPGRDYSHKDHATEKELEAHEAAKERIDGFMASK